MKCFQIELKYINNNNQEVGVTINSDPIPIGLNVNKDNENQIVSDILNYIYDNNDATGHQELMLALNEASTISQININEQPVSLPVSEKSIKFQKSDVTKINLNKLASLEAINNNDVNKTLLNNLLKNNKETAFKTKVYQISGVVDTVNNKLTPNSDDFTKSSYYDRTTNNLFIANDSILQTKKGQLELQEALLNSLLPANSEKDILEISNTENDFNPLTLGIDIGDVPKVLNVLVNIKDEVANATKVKKASTHSLKKLSEDANNIVVDYPIDKNKPNEHFGNPFTEMTDLPIKAKVMYSAWISNANLPLSAFLPSQSSLKELGDIEPERRKWIVDQIRSEKLKGKTLITDKKDGIEHASNLKSAIDNFNSPYIKDQAEKTKQILKSFYEEDSNISVKINGVTFKNVNEGFKDFLRNKYNSISLNNVNSVDFDLLTNLNNLKGTEVNYDDFLNQMYNESVVELTPRVGDKVEYAGNEYLFWKLNDKGNARLIKADGTKYSGTPNTKKLKTLSRGNIFEFRNTSYAKWGGSVISLSTGIKIKDLKILQAAELNQSLLFSADIEPTALRNGFTYSSDQTAEYNRHLKIRKAYSDKNQVGKVTRISEMDARIARNEVISKLGVGAVSDVTSFITPYGKSLSTFTIYAPKQLNRSYQELVEFDEANRVKQAVINNTLVYENDWENLTDEQKVILDKERYDYESSVLGNISISQSKNPYGGEVDPLYDYLFKQSDTLTAMSIIEELSKRRPLAKKLLEYGDMLEGVNVTAVPADVIIFKNEKGEEVRAKGTFNTGSKQIRVAKYHQYNPNYGTSEDTLLHEILHAITYDYLQHYDDDIVNDWINLYEEVKGKIPEYQYPLTDRHEFLTGVFTNRLFKKRLNNIPADGKRTLWGKILDFFRKMFNFESAAFDNFMHILTQISPTIDSDSESYLSKATELGHEILDKIYANQNRILENGEIDKQRSKDINSSYKSSNEYLGSIIPSARMETPPATKLAKNESLSERAKLREFSKRLGEKYGLEIQHLTSQEINDQFSKNGLQYGNHRAFIENGNIVINTDFATFAEPLHELSHLILDGLKLTNITAYDYILDEVVTHPIYQYVQKLYPELNEIDLAEEAFVTIIGERYNGSIASETAKEWENAKPNFFNRVVNSFKNFLSELFGIDSHSFRSLSGTELMNIDFDTIINEFTNSALNGDFIKEVNLAKQKQVFIENGNYLESDFGQTSSFYNKLINSNDISPDLASKIWLGTKTQNFYNWHKGDLNLNIDGEPRIFYRGDYPNVIYDIDVLGNNDAVVVKGNIVKNQDSSYTIPSSNARSVYNIDQGKSNSNEYTIESVAQNKSISLVGDRIKMNKSVNQLQKLFPDYDFSVNMYGDTNFISYSLKPHPDVADLRNLLLKQYSYINC